MKEFLSEQWEPACLETILFVEDEAFVREVTCELLRSAGYEVLVAKEASEALRIYEERGSEVALLLTDVMLPGETGRTLAGRLRRQNPVLKVLYVTGYAEQMATCESAREAFLAKPFSSDALLERVRQVLEWQIFPAVQESKATHVCGGA